MAGAKVNGDGVKSKAKPGRPKKETTIATATKAAPKATKATRATPPTTKKSAKRAAEEDEEDDEESQPQAKKAKVAPQPKPRPKAVAKKVTKPKKAPANVPIPQLDALQLSEEAEEIAAESDTETAPQAAPEATAPKAKEKIQEFHKDLKHAYKPSQHKIGPKINDPPSQKINVYVFGEGSSGELGLSNRKIEGKNPIDVTRPRLNPLLSVEKAGVVHIAVGGMHCAALTHDNKILTWGVNDQGALGRNTTWDGGVRDMDDDDSDAGELNPLESTPTAIESKWFADDAKFTQLVASDSATFAVTEDGAVYGWGTFRNNEGILGFNESVLVQWKPVLIPELKKIVELAAGSNHILARNQKGKVFAWGCGQQNQLGRRVIERTSLAGLVPRDFGLRGLITKIACGSYHSFAIDSKGQVFSWGLNSFGETGVAFDEDTAFLLKPTIVKNLEGSDIVDISGGSHHSIASTRAGDVLVWGRCDGGQCGIELGKLDPDNVFLDEREKPKTILVPTKVEGINDTVLVNAGSDNSFAVTKDGKVYSWGFNANYQTGQGGDEDDVLEAKLIDNSAVKDQTIIGAFAGGQFGVLTGLTKGA